MSKKLQGKTGKAGATQELTAQSSANQGKYYKYEWELKGFVYPRYEGYLGEDRDEAIREAKRQFESFNDKSKGDRGPNRMTVYEVNKATKTSYNEDRRMLAEFSR